MMAGTATALPGRYAKFLTAIAANVLLYSEMTWGATNRWVELATAVAAALGVLAVPNTPPPTAPSVAPAPPVPSPPPAPPVPPAQ